MSAPVIPILSSSSSSTSSSSSSSPEVPLVKKSLTARVTEGSSARRNIPGMFSVEPVVVGGDRSGGAAVPAEDEFDDLTTGCPVRPTTGGKTVLPERRSRSQGSEDEQEESSGSSSNSTSGSSSTGGTPAGVAIGFYDDAAFPDPEPDFVPYGGPTKSTDDSLHSMLAELGKPEGIKTRIPDESHRPWTPTPKYICLQESFFRQCRLKFPLPRLLLEFFWARRLAFSQVTGVSIFILMELMRMSVEVGVLMTREHLDELIGVTRLKEKPGRFYFSIKGQHQILMKKPSKIQDWEDRYFYVKINEFSVEDPNASFVSKWRSSYVRKCPGQPYPLNFAEDVEALRNLSRKEFPELWSEKEKKEGKKKMGKPSLKVPSYADDLKKSSGKKMEAGGSQSKLPTKKDPAPPAGGDRVHIELAPQKKFTPELSAQRKTTPPPQAAAAPSKALVINEGALPSRSRPAGDPLAKNKGIVTDSSVVPPASEPQKVLGKRGREDSGAVEATERRDPPPPPRVFHGFRYEYTKDSPFIGSQWDCADLFSRIKGAAGAFPRVEDLRENQAYLDVARSQARLAADINLLTARYDSRAKRLSAERDKANESLRVSAANFDKMTKALDAKNSEIATLVKELDRAGDAVKKADQEKTELWRQFEAEKAGYELRLKNQGEEHRKFQEVWERRRIEYAQEVGREVADTTRGKVKAEYEARLGRIADYLNGKKKADEVIAKFAQVSGTIDVLKLIADEDRVEIPEARMEQLKKDRASLEEQAQGMEIPDLLPGDVPGFVPEEDAEVSSMDVDVEPGEMVASEVREDPPPE